MSDYKHFVVLFLPFKNIDLVKDVGQIPSNLYREYEYKVTIACYKNEKEYSYLENEAPGIQIEHISKRRFPFSYLSPILYLLKNAQSIDILNLYHFSLQTVIFGVIFRLLSRKGILYLKTDLHVIGFEKYSPLEPSKNKLKAEIISRMRWVFQEIILRLFFFSCSIISTETRLGLSLLQKRYPLFKDKFVYIPNGAISCACENNERELIKAKENLIIIAGRIGAPEKNHEMFLRAIEQIELKNWKIVFLGTIENDFKKLIDISIFKKPTLKNQLIMPGNISDRNLLNEYYSKGKVLCLTSNRESFAIVLVEALSFGNFIITTNIPSANDIISNGKYGIIVNFDDDNTLAKNLQSIIDDTYDIYKNMGAAISYARINFSWPTIVSRLYESFSLIK